MKIPKLVYSNVVRIFINVSLAAFVSYDVVSKIKCLDYTSYELIWKSQLVFILMCDVLFMSRNLFKQPKMVDASVLAVGAGCLASILPYAMSMFTWWSPITETLKTPGMVLNALVCPFILWALFCLRDCLSVIPEANKVVSKGIYKYSRHPLYVCYSFWGVSYIMMDTTFPVICIVVAFVSLLLVRSILEERVLLKSLPAYESYYRQTGLITLPFLHFKLG